MTNQEEIREALKKYLKPNLKYEEESLVDGVVYMVLETLHSQGVVLKVERGLPDIPSNAFEDYKKYEVEEKCRLTQRDMLGTGYSATEPLIKEG